MNDLHDALIDDYRDELLQPLVDAEAALRFIRRHGPEYPPGKPALIDALVVVARIVSEWDGLISPGEIEPERTELAIILTAVVWERCCCRVECREVAEAMLDADKLAEEVESYR